MRRLPFQRQQGMTLIVALVMLVLITMLAMTTFNLGKSSIQVVGNMQNRDEGVAASRQVIDEALSSTRFFNTPADALASPCDGSNTRCLDMNGDGKADVQTVLSPPPSCVKARSIKSSELDFTNTEDQGCVLGGSQSFGVAGTVTGDSLCADSTWEVSAVSTDQVAQTSVQVVQGVAVRVAKDDIEASCP
jgi:Tfp pilus assembly protein PilX